MLIIDLRPYEKEQLSKPLQTILEDHIRQVRGPTQVIYNKPDLIIMTRKQSKEFKDYDFDCSTDIQ